MDHDEHDSSLFGDFEQFVTNGDFDEQPRDDVDPFGAESVESLDCASGISDRCDGISEVVHIDVQDSSSKTLAESGSCSSINFTEVLQSASQSLPIDTVKPIWEQGVWASIFGSQENQSVTSYIDSSFVRPKISLDMSQFTDDSHAVVQKSRRVKEDYFDVVKFKPSSTWQEQQEAGWQQAVKLWYSLICRWDIRCKMLGEFSVMDGAVECCEMLSDIFRGRSFVTLKKRALAVLKICNYLEIEMRGQFPCTEREYYDSSFGTSEWCSCF